MEQRPRSVSDPTHGLRGKLVNTFQEESFRLMATTEKKRRLHAEKQLDKFKSDQLLELRFPELLQLDTDKNSEDVSGDDSSSTTSTLDEGNFKRYNELILFGLLSMQKKINLFLFCYIVLGED